MEELLKRLSKDSGEEMKLGISAMLQFKLLTSVLIDKGIITNEDLYNKFKEKGDSYFKEIENMFKES